MHEQISKHDLKSNNVNVWAGDDAYLSVMFAVAQGESSRTPGPLLYPHYGAGIQSQRRALLRGTHEVLCAHILHSPKLTAGQLYQRPLSEVRVVGGYRAPFRGLGGTSQDPVLQGSLLARAQQ
jgi:hypothetical protein